MTAGEHLPCLDPSAAAAPQPEKRLGRAGTGALRSVSQSQLQRRRLGQIIGRKMKQELLTISDCLKHEHLLPLPTEGGRTAHPPDSERVHTDHTHTNTHTHTVSPINRHEKVTTLKKTHTQSSPDCIFQDLEFISSPSPLLVQPVARKEGGGSRV